MVWFHYPGGHAVTFTMMTWDDIKEKLKFYEIIRVFKLFDKNKHTQLFLGKFYQLIHFLHG